MVHMQTQCTEQSLQGMQPFQGRPRNMPVRSFTPPPPWGAFYLGGRGMGPRPPQKSCPYAIIYNLRAEPNHTSKV